MDKTILIIISIIGFIFLVGGVFTPQGMMGGWSSNNMMNFGFGTFAGFGWIFMLVFWGLIIWLFISLIRGSFGDGHMCGHNHGDEAHEKTALDILKERYAKGEINKQEFEEKKKDLGA